MGESSIAYRLSSQLALPVNAQNLADSPWGFRASPKFTFSADGFSLELRLDGGVAQSIRTPLGAKYFGAHPTSTIPDNSSLLGFYYEPKDENDRLRANLGLRSLMAGFELSPELQLKLGRYRYDITELENWITNGAFTWQTDFAFVDTPLHWLGGQLSYDWNSSDGILKKLFVSAALSKGEDAALSVLQGLARFSLGNSKDAPQLAMTGYYSRLMALDDPASASTNGYGIAAQLTVQDLSITAAHTHSNANGSETRDVESLAASFKVADLQLRAAVSLLRADGLTKKPHGTELHGELLLGYQLADGLLLCLGYRGTDGTPLMPFLGIQTSFSGKVSLGEDSES